MKVALGIYLVYFVVVAGLVLNSTLRHNAREAAQDSDITIIHHEGTWGYYFTDPYGFTIIGGKYLTKGSAQRAAQRHRNAVAKELQEALGL